MLTISNPLDISIPFPELTGFSTDEIIYFDIETTGFNINNTHLYLIGCVYFDLQSSSKSLTYTQFFAENTEEEPELISSFFKLISNYKALISYNGEGFDIPYILKKCQKYNLTFSFDNIKSIDIYKSILPFKKYFPLDNLKQKSIEKYLGISRKDIYDGGKLIEVYFNFLKEPSMDLLELLLLHNKEDILYLTQLTSILSYPALKDANVKLESLSENTIPYANSSEVKELEFRFKAIYPVPQKISLFEEDFYLSIDKDIIILTFRIFETELKYFYPNFKDYYYLPLEDMAIHKSVGAYVDKNHREKATCANCYTKKSGYFLPQYEPIFIPEFKKDYKDKKTYFELTRDFLESNEKITKYLKHFLSRL